MEAKEIKPILDAIGNLRTPLDAIALLMMADEFYTKDKRVALYAEYQVLLDADAAAYQHLQESCPKDNLSREQRIDRFGEAVANEQHAMKSAMEARKETLRRIDVFVQEHRLIVRLANAKAAIGKGKYE